MKLKWYVLLFAAAPYAAMLMLMQSCGGEGGSTGNGGGGSSFSAEFLALMSDQQKVAKPIGSEACAPCHGGKAEDPVYRQWHETKHASVNVGCESCHGPGSVHKEDPSKGNILKQPVVNSPVVCGQCHGPIVDNWNFSKHAKLILSPVEEAIQDPDRYGRTSRCIACHSGLTRSSIVDAGIDMATLTNEQIQKVAEDTLNVVPYTASCSTCHNPHAKTGNLNGEGEEKQLRHKTFNTDTSQIGPGTQPAQFTTFDHLCAQCHNGRGTNPADGALQKGTSRPSMHDSNQFNMLMGIGGVEGGGVVERNTAHANAPGQCTKCHMPDARHTFTVSLDKSCAPCHTANDAEARLSTNKDQIQTNLYVIRTRMSSWAKKTLGDELFWEYTSNIQAEGKTPPDQSLIPIEIKRARHNYYFVIRSNDYGAHNAPYAKHLIRIAGDNLDALGANARPNGQKMPNRDEIAKILLGDYLRANEVDRR